MMKKLFPLFIISFVFHWQAALGNPQNAASCAAVLNSDARMIYDEAAQKVTPATPIRDTLTSVTRGLVMGGKISRGAARPAAEAAGQCLQILSPR